MPQKKAPKTETRTPGRSRQAAKRGPDGKFLPGQSGNPNGRPKARVISEIMRDLLGEPASIAQVDLAGKTFAEHIAALVMRGAAKGNPVLINAILDRTEGKPRQMVGIGPASLLQSEDWAKFRELIAQALEPFPEAAAAVLRAIDQAEGEDGDDKLG